MPEYHYYAPDRRKVVCCTESEARKQALAHGAPDDNNPDFIGWNLCIVKGLVINGKHQKIRCKLPVWGKLRAAGRNAELRWLEHEQSHGQLLNLRMRNEQE